jgi:hypothetical protein
VERATNNRSHDFEFLGADRSISRSGGETDLEFRIVLPGGESWVFLIENKIGACFQKDQAKRYRERAGEYVRNAYSDVAKSVLIAPAEYMEQNRASDDFDVRIRIQSCIPGLPLASRIAARHIAQPCSGEHWKKRPPAGTTVRR